MSKGGFPDFSDMVRVSNNRANRRDRLIAARKLGTHTKEQWLALKLEFQNRCVRCGNDKMNVEKDHILPLYLCGSDGIDNIQPVCALCNSSKNSESINWKELIRKHGWSFPSNNR